MQLLTQKIKQKLSSIYDQEKVDDPIVHLKLFTPDSDWTWFITEGEELENGDWKFFGVVTNHIVGMTGEWGYSLLSEIKKVRGVLKLPVERDKFFSPKSISECLG